MRSATRRLPALALAAALAMPMPSVAQEQSLDNLAQELIRLRNDVESLHSELENKREKYRTELRSLAGQKAELGASKRREQLNIQQLEKTLAEKREAARESGVSGDALEPVVLEAIAKLDERIRNGMPFKPKERLASLKEIRLQLESGSISPQQGVSRLWSFYEDELRLTSENGIYSQVVELDGDELLVEIARLGMALMYFRTKNQEYGMAENSPEGWRFERVSDSEDARRIEKLFDSLGKQIRTGFFTLPNPGIGVSE